MELESLQSLPSITSDLRASNIGGREGGGLTEAAAYTSTDAAWAALLGRSLMPHSISVAYISGVYKDPCGSGGCRLIFACAHIRDRGALGIDNLKLG